MGSSTRLGRMARLAGILYIVALTVALVVPSGDPHMVRRWLTQRHWLALHSQLSTWRLIKDIVINVLLFVPAGAWVAWELRRPFTSPVARLTATIVALAAYSFVAESIQYFVPGRVSSIVDVVANTAGAALGALLLAGVHGWVARPSTRRVVVPMR